MFSIFLFILNIESIYAQNIENWQTFTDPAKRFIIFYPPDLEIKGRENFLSSVDVTLGNQNFDRGFKITVTYNDDDKSLLDHVKGLGISPDNYLLAMEEQLKPSYQVYHVGEKFLRSENLYGFPTVSNTVDYTNYLGESGRLLSIEQSVSEARACRYCFTPGAGGRTCSGSCTSTCSSTAAAITRRRGGIRPRRRCR